MSANSGFLPSAELQELLAHAPCLLWRADHRGQCDYVSPRWLAFTGRTVDKEVGMGWAERVHPEDRPSCVQRFREAMGNRGPYEARYRLLRHDGEYRWMQSRGDPLLSPAGEFRGYAGSCADITERVRAEEAVRQNEKRLEALVELGAMGDRPLQEVMDHGLEQAVELTGSRVGYIYFFEEETGLFTLYSWSNSAMEQCAVVEKQTVYELHKTGLWGEAVRQRRPIVVNDFEAENQWKRGYPEGHVQLSRYLTLPVIRQDRIVAVVGVGNKASDYDEGDVCQLQLYMDRLWVIVERQAADDRLRISEGRFRTLFESSPISIWEEDFSGVRAAFDDLRRAGVADLRAHLSEHPEEVRRLAALVRILDINQRSADLLGASSKEAVVRNLPTYFSPASLEVFREELAVLAEGGTTFHCEIPVVAAGGRQMLLSLHLAVQPGHEHDLGRVLVSFIDISDRKRAEEDLLRAHEQYRAVLDTSLDGYWLLDRSGTILGVNEAACRLSGYAPSELVGSHISLVEAKETPEETRSHVEQVVAKGVDRFETRHRRKDGEVRDVEISTTFVPSQDQLVVFVRDIADRKRAEEAMRKSEESHRLLFEHSMDGIFLTSPEGPIFAANPAACEFLQKSEEELREGGRDAVVDPSDPRLPVLLEERRRTGRAKGAVRFRRKDGSSFEVELSSALFPVRGGEERAVILFRDVSERRLMEEALRASEERYRHVVEDQTEVIARFLPDGTLTFVNDVYSRFFGKKSEEVVGGKWQPKVVAEDLPEVEEKLLRLSPGHPVVTLENRVYADDGRVLWMQFVNRGFFDAEGRLTEVQAVGRDITRLKETQAELQEYHGKLQKLAAELTLAEERERRRIAQDLHDNIGQTLAFAKIRLGSVGVECQPDRCRAHVEEVRKALDSVIAETRSLTFDLSPPVLYQFGIAAALERLAEHLCSAAGLSWEFESGPLGGPLGEDLQVLAYRVVRELLTNVVKHAAAAHVRVAISKDGGTLRVDVEDDGVGFDPESAAAGSQGLGLFSIRERLHQRGGALDIGPRPEGGTRASILIPWGAEKGHG